ncbi:hypothetical protein F5883DRAFT_702628 [Diaporthe sp. PMI_573]|nr:hypothetical protein F5883DRAFT_702628 [Diaporthaceae sp. PMI_573]
MPKEYWSFHVKEALALVESKKPVIPKQVLVRDITNELDKYSLETHGFQYFKHKSQLSGDDFANEEKVKTAYYEETKELLKKVTGASYIYVWEHLTRGPVKPVYDATNKYPVRFVHCDQSYWGAEVITTSRIPDEDLAQRIVKGRYSLVNVWRPVKTVYKEPFGCTDAQSVEEKDLSAISFFADPLVEEGWGFGANPGHRWYFKYKQEPDEELIFKCFDSHGPARRLAHSSFSNPAHADAEERESVELRAVLWFGDDEE